MNTSYYIIGYYAEENGYKVVSLNEEEAAAIRKISQAPFLRGGGYCGSIDISEPFDSKEKAEEACWEGNF